MVSLSSVVFWISPSMDRLEKKIKRKRRGRDDKEVGREKKKTRNKKEEEET